MRARMVPVGTIAEPLHRAVRDLARSHGQGRSSWEVRGEETELDRACSSSSPTRCSTWSATPSTTASSARRRGWRPASRRYGTVRVHADAARLRGHHHGGRRRPGHRPGPGPPAGRRGRRRPRRGRRRGGHLPIFRSGLSTAATVSEMSGRGVGLDVVRASLAAVRGRVEVRSEPGAGSEFRLIVPITLAVLPCLLVEAAGRRFARPDALGGAAPRQPAGPRTTSRARSSSGCGTRSCPSPTWPPPSASPPARPRRRPATARPWCWPA